MTDWTRADVRKLLNSYADTKYGVSQEVQEEPERDPIDEGYPE